MTHQPSFSQAEFADKKKITRREKFLTRMEALNAEQLRVHTMLVIGGRDMEAGAVSVRLHHGGQQGAKPKGEVVADILAAIKERRS